MTAKSRKENSGWLDRRKEERKEKEEEISNKG